MSKLESSVKQRLEACREQMAGEGKLLSPEKLDQLYLTFRNRFAPERLAGLDGVPLLEAMHLHANHDSLVYWLEFKNDDEFPARFGSIAGGSALKFGVFKRKETGAWTKAGESNYPTEITVDEAINIARRHRDQLVRGVELLRQLPDGGSDADYARLQQMMDSEAPDVSTLAWGHKYFSLLFPDKLDDYHSPEWQRFHLIKMLQMPPERSGRYVCGGRFVASARELGVPINTLTSVLNAANGRKHGYWRIGTSDATAPRNRWDLMRNGACVAIGWPKLGDLSSLEVSTEYSATTPNKETRDRLKRMLAETYPNTPAVIGRFCTQIINFVKVIAAGDYVVACDGDTVLGVGRVIGDYLYVSDSDFPHRRPVAWLALDEWKKPHPEGLLSAVYLMKEPANLLEVERRVQGTPEPPHPPPKPTALRTGTGARPPTLDKIPGRIQSVLDRKRQVILYGPPGTGKTHWAEKTACDLAAYVAFGNPFGELTKEDQATVFGSADSLVRICCFHPAYGYEDFIEGYRPKVKGGHVVFRLRAGVFKQVCKHAERAPDRDYFLIVDEINRGDIPRIFGELLTVLEKNKRRKAIVLPVSGQPLRVPENVYLIGTMNTADRSISLLDAALRRRFGFVELMPDVSVLDGHAIEGVPLSPWLAALNRRVCAHVGRDARNLQVGHSYLLDDGRPIRDLAAFKRALRDDILPLLEEYCYENFDALRSILGDGFVDRDAQRLKHELFDDGQEEALLQALKDPDVETSTQAVSAAGSPAEEVEDESADDEADEGDR
jgi:5-methylcytosine-specific restriction protein B